MRPWQVISRRRIVEKDPWLRLYEEEVELPNGRRIPDYLTSEEPDVAMMFAVTTDDHVLLVEQYKHGIRGVALDLPAGYVDPDEDPFDAARRELEEETGHRGADWTPLGAYYYSENRHQSRFHYYLLRGAEPTGRVHLDETEELVVHRMPLAGIPDLIASGRVCGIHSALGLYRGLDALGRGPSSHSEMR